MRNGHLRKAIYTAIAGACVGLTLSGWSYGYRVAQSDFPAEGKAQHGADIQAESANRHDDTMNVLRLIQAIEVKAAWWRCINAVEARQTKDTIDQLQADLANEQDAYMAMNNGIALTLGKACEAR